MAAVAQGWPTLSELQASTFDHLGRFADWCERVGGEAERALERLAREVRAPGGVEWEGAAGEAAITQADADVITARPFVWGLADAAVIARRGQDVLQAGQRLALDAVDDAHRDGFEVGEDYRVTDTREAATSQQLAQRQAAAQAHADFIRYRVAQLVANDQHLTAELNEATATWGTLTFPESGGADQSPNGQHDGHVRLVDWKTGPGQSPQPSTPSAQDIREAIKNLPEGTAPSIKEIRSEQDLRTLWDWLTKNAKGFAGSSTYPGREFVLGDGTRVGLRQSDDHGSTIDIRYPDKEPVKVHINTARGGVPNIPAPPGEPVAPKAAAEPPARAPTEGTPPVKPSPGTGEGGGALPRLPFGGLPWDSPATGPHVVHTPDEPRHSPVLGELPEEFEGPKP
ncbi:hypothetical protein MSM1_13210 [Mycobacterium sp. SM1]|uniref:hypothetical protein n=1 Tax=Mycobacterium sp. SM1 TaxID=2816243 RepID=UPI001BCF0E94|nr:hypothetical protein [Mycobacterium sp. SM1]MBS4729253.1 hypothetical protein [Mycobacterium sp. SM1]